MTDGEKWGCRKGEGERRLIGGLGLEIHFLTPTQPIHDGTTDRTMATTARMRTTGGTSGKDGDGGRKRSFKVGV